jgi:hypothetical protein
VIDKGKLETLMLSSPTTRLCLLSIVFLLLGCGDSADTRKGAIGAGDASSAIDALSTLEQASPAPAEAPPRPDQLSDKSIVLMGSLGRTITIYKSASLYKNGSLQDKPHFSGPLKTAPTGTRGILLHSINMVDWTYAMDVELVDGTRGVVDAKDVGLLQRVQGVRMDDTLNVRAGRSHKHPKVTELGPTEAVFVEVDLGTHAAGCLSMQGKQKWWKVRTTDGSEGYVNCMYLGRY